jgi:branched-chain amino acid transport system ATP-binding protein
MMLFLTLENVSKSFGGLNAVSNLSLEIQQGEVVGLIGPNGAGKTTVFNLITGVYPPDAGRIVFDGYSLVGLRPYKIARLRLSRTFQIVKPFGDLSVLQNVMIGAFQQTRNRKEARERACNILEFMNLTRLMNARADSLTLSARKQLEIARTLVTGPRMLLLDESMSGMTPAELNTMIELVKKINDKGVTLLIIEHIMKVIMSITDRIIVLDYGKKIADGKPEEISRNQEVIAAYLGVLPPC